LLLPGASLPVSVQAVEQRVVPGSRGSWLIQNNHVETRQLFLVLPE